MLLFQQMLALFALMLVGYICRRIKIIDEQTSKKLSVIVVNVANPAMILSGSVGSDFSVGGKALLLTMGIAVGMYAVLLALAYLSPLVLRARADERGAYRVMMLISNVGFMGFPIISAVYGSGALIHASLFLLPFNLLIYTVGVKESKPDAGGEKEPFKLKQVFNIGVIACFVSLFVYLLKIPAPQFVVTSVKSLAALAAPLSMMVLGASLADMHLAELFTDVRLIAFSLIKQIVVPVAGMLIFRQFVHDEALLGVCLIMLATPVGSMTAMLAQQYDGNFRLTTKGVALTTLMSVGTIPLVAALVF